jgi:mannose-6-phosphate isomerase-like protein (cupin superfamily)
MKVALALAIALTVFSLPVLAQSQGKAQVFPAADVHNQFAKLVDEAKAKGSSGYALGDYGTHAIRIAARTKSGGGEIHAHFDDVMLVTEGTATLITGGTVIDPHTGSDGETRGTGILNGTAQTVTVGDVIHISAGTPHQLIVAPGTTYSYIVIKVKE